MTEYLLYILNFLNVVAFALYGADKHRAIKNRRRISEKTLILWGIIAPFGSFIAMKFFHHKTRKPKFEITVFLMCIVWFVAIGTALHTKI
ncbi:MAG: DUF1294 domain-containing protein [Oscillospiraceae bacterium]|nr:DUF1294 domain-containing protein [Oscillospiraceae bacterium]